MTAPNNARRFSGVVFLLRAASGKTKTFALSDAADLVQRLATGGEQAMSDAVTALTDSAFAQLVQAAQNALGDTDTAPTDDTRPEGWSWWTQGDLVIGNVKGTDGASRQEADDVHVFFGMDRPARNDGRFGFAVGLGKSDTDVGDTGGGVESDNYGLSGYATFRLPSSHILEITLGYGRLRMDTIRIDGGETLTGKRDGNQLFGSVAHMPF